MAYWGSTIPRLFTSSGGNHRTPTIQENDNLFRDTIKTRCRYHDSNSGQWERITSSDDLWKKIHRSLPFGTSELWLFDSKFVMVQNQSTSIESTRYCYSLRDTFTRKSIWHSKWIFVIFKNYDSFFDYAKQLIIFAFHLHYRIYLVTLLRQWA